MSDLASFSIDLTPTGRGIVEVNGQHLEDQIAGLSLQAKAGQPPLLVLQFVPGKGTIEGSGVVRVPYESKTAAVEAVEDFLDSIDAGHLEAEVLSRVEGFGGDSVVVITLNVLREWARGG